MNYSSLAKVAGLTAIFLFLVSCQASPSPTTNSPTETAPATSTPEPMPTPDPQVISPANAGQLVLKSVNMGMASSSDPTYSSDGKWLFVASSTGTYAFDTVSYKGVSLLAPMPFSTLSPDGKSLAIGSVDGIVRLYGIDGK